MSESDLLFRPKVSVIIPTFNRANDLKRCLESLVTQTYKDFEVLVCDDGSTDSSQQVATSFTDRLNIAYFWGENFGGPARPRNVGLKHAKGEYVAFLDSDDWWMPEKLRASVEQLEAGADIVYHEMYLITSLPAKPRFWKRSIARHLKSPVFHDLLLNGHAINNSSVVVKRELMNRIGGFSEDPLLIAAEDYDAWLQIAKHTEAFVRLNKTLGYYWDGGGNISTAERNICNLKRLADLYRDEEAGGGDFSSSPAYTYAMGKSNYALGQFDTAEAYFKETLSKARFANLRIRAIIWYLASRLKK